MPETPPPFRFLRFGRQEKLRTRARRLARLLRLPAWFPHLPLALAAALLGLRLLGLAYNARLGQLAAHFPAVLAQLRPAGMPFLLIGLALLLMSLVLMLRSRLGWSIALLLAVATILAARLLPHSPSPLLPQFAALLLAALLLSHRSFNRRHPASRSPIRPCPKPYRWSR